MKNLLLEVPLPFGYMENTGCHFVQISTKCMYIYFIITHIYTKEMMMSTKEVSPSKTVSSKQQIFLKYLTFTLVDLTVLNFFAEYWERVNITSFGVSLLVAVILQILLKMTLHLEHRTTEFFKSREKSLAKVGRIVSTWFILFASKFVMLGVLQFVFQGQIHFEGAYHGVVAFIVLVVTILLAEAAVAWLYEYLGEE